MKRSKKDEADSKAAQQAALEYLSLYLSARQEWKFSKPRQNYIIKNAYDDSIFDKGLFENVLKYIESIQGASRDRIQETAEGMVKRFKNESSEEQKDETQDDEVESVTEDQAGRARKVIEVLQQRSTSTASSDSSSD